MAYSLYSLALEYNLGDKVKNEFIDKKKKNHQLFIGKPGSQWPWHCLAEAERYNWSLKRDINQKQEGGGQDHQGKSEGSQGQLFSNPQQFQNFAPMAPMPIVLGPF